MSILNFCPSNRYLEQRLEHCRDKMFRIAFSWSHDAMLADDIVQEALIKALVRLKQLKNPEVLEPWVISILNNVWIDYLRQKKEFVDIDDYIQHAPANDTPDIHYENDHLTSLVHEAIEALPMGQRQVISLVDLAGYSYSEVSQILDIAVGTVMSRFNRARKKMLSELSNENQVVFLHKR